MVTKQVPPRDARILIIDDDEIGNAGLVRLLKTTGFEHCVAVSCPLNAVAQLLEINPDIVLLDLHMKPISGIEVLKRINDLMEPETRPPIIMLTADTSADAKHEALAAGVSDFLPKPLDSVEVILRIGNLLTSRELYQRCQLYSNGLERLVDRRTAELQQKTMDLENTVAELTQTQHQVIQQERMRALGTMASGIAHDLNNGLSLILGYGDMLLADKQAVLAGTETESCVNEMVLAARDNAELVKRLREFYRPADAREPRQAVNVNELIDQALGLTAPRWHSQADNKGATIRIKKDLDDVPNIAGSPVELREVLTNLIFNAVDAMPRGGRLCFRTRCRGKTVRLQVSDTGTGMTEEVRRNCLEPFFTTKGEKGSGLGLAMSYGIIRRHGGRITVESALNKGTVFTIHFPVPKEAIRPPVVEFERPVPALRVLVVDDHPGIREIVSAYLAEDCHTVETAANANEALEKFRESQFDLVITDRAMPEMNGDQLAASIKELRPQEPIIMLTGFADLIHASGGPSRHVDLVMSKPARLDDLRRAILEVLPDGEISAGPGSVVQFSSYSAA
jgi:signal transduction histidine kinase